MKKVVRIFFSPIVSFLLLLHQKITISSYLDVTLFNDDIFDSMLKSELSYMSNHLSFNENNKSNKRKKRNDSATDDIYILTQMLSQIIPYNFSIYSLSLPDETVSNNNSDVNNFLDLINMYDADINNTITHHLNKTEPIKGCENDIKNHNCDKDVLSCITLKKNYLSETCKKSLNNSLLYSCVDDFLHYCSDYTKFSKIHKCLKKNFYHLNDKCLNILSYYEHIVQKLHKIKRKPYDNQEHLFLEKDKGKEKSDKADTKVNGSSINSSSSRTGSVVRESNSGKNLVGSKYNLKATDTGNDKNDEKYNLFNKNSFEREPTIVDSIRKGYGHYFFPSMDYNNLFDFNSRTYEYKYYMYFVACLFILFLFYILVISVKKYYTADSNSFLVHNEKTKLAQL
ncbi:conserved Plasmodium protein, unknown function [Plasmodium malariae]|uniref:PIR Superfamily Protein n=1 Tax=Plasmodium malariae TaxID=5858 RepID=A0A1A8WXD6_PLAMA|nr:conserved Plasmodium protein, unknown function [Plasmodium malariae]SBS96546.1 conserved Plasmodium protein, unknown function [Plasmodium malariae]SCO93081.1 conserved Plasmodium protein, unknown function [Plasmodium malariae]